MSIQPVAAENIISSPPPLEAPLQQSVLHHLYATMLRARMLGQRLRSATRTGEAIVAGALQNAEESDVIVSATATPILEALRGADLSTLASSKNDLRFENKKVVTVDGEVFAGVAAGIAAASLRRQSDSVVLAFAPGKLTRGAAFGKAARFIADNRLPLVLLADWTDARRSSRNHDGRELSHWPFPTIAVDGRDVIAVYRVTKEAISAARRGHGPTLVDCVNFLAPGGRGRDTRDPLAAYRGYLERHNAWSDLWQAELLTRLREEIGTAGRTRSNERSRQP